MKKGKLIVIEGACDGIGKTTQYKLLKKHLEKDGLIVKSHHFPSYGTFQGKGVEMYLRGQYGTYEELSPYFVNSLYAHDRAITWNSELKRQYEQGRIVLLDRYTTSSIIYQSSVIKDKEKRKEFIDYICDFEYEKLGIQRPDSIIFLHAPFDLVTKIRAERKSNEGIKNDIHERDIEFMKRVYENSMEIADYLNWEKISCSQDNQLLPKEEIHEKVYKKVKENI